MGRPKGTKSNNNAEQSTELNADLVTNGSNESKMSIVPKDIDINQLIPVKNGFNGKLIYKSSRTGETFRWPEFGAEQEIELRELRNAKNTARAFFENNWFMFSDDDKWVIDYLGVSRYYKFAVDIDDFDSVFDKEPDEIVAIIANLSAGQKNSLSYRARQLVADGTIDSRKVISVLEKSLNTELIEK